MPSIHATVDRLYLAAQQLRDVKGQSAVARLLEVTPQVVKNWESRGLSNEGALLAQKRIGCDANWLLDGSSDLNRKAWAPREDSPVGFASDIATGYHAGAASSTGAQWPFRRVTREQYAALSTKQQDHLEDTIYVILGVGEETPAKSGLGGRPRAKG